MVHHESWKPIYFGVKSSKVKVTRHKNIAGVDHGALVSSSMPSEGINPFSEHTNHCGSRVRARVGPHTTEAAVSHGCCSVAIDRHRSRQTWNGCAFRRMGRTATARWAGQTSWRRNKQVMPAISDCRPTYWLVLVSALLMTRPQPPRCKPPPFSYPRILYVLANTADCKVANHVSVVADCQREALRHGTTDVL